MGFENAAEIVKKLEPIAQSAISEIIKKELTISSNVIGEKAPAEFLNAQTFPNVCVHLQSGGTQNPVMHLIFIPVDFVKQFYSWMIDDKPAEELTDDHLEGLKEGVQQVFGQIKMNVADDEAQYVLDQVNVFQVEAPDKLSSVLTTETGFIDDFELKIEDATFNLGHFCWAVEQNGAKVDESEDGSVSVQPAEFGNLKGKGADTEDPRNVDMLMDVDLEVSVELDRKTVLVSELLKLGKGSIVELEKSAGEPLDIYVNGRKFAEGEVVVIDDRFGIRITQLLSPKDRVKSLG